MRVHTRMVNYGSYVMYLNKLLNKKLQWWCLSVEKMVYAEG